MSPRSPSTPASASAKDRYQYERRLGEGGSGAVYLVRDLETGEQLALKKLLRVDAKSVLRLKREFRSMQAVNHPHIIKLYDMGQVDDSWFLTMEYLDGVDLATYLAREDRLAASKGQAGAGGVGNPRLITAFRQLARGIHALHDVGLLHRDLKPSNVIVVDHRVVVLDFGLVRQLSTQSEKLTEDGSVSGTPAYMAPEQLMAKELTAATDWYAFGVMLFEAISGMLPIDGPLIEMLHAKVDKDPPSLATIAPETPRWVVELCAALLSRDPKQRPSGDAVLAKFDAADPQTPLTQTSADQVPHTEAEAHEAQARVFGRDREVEQLWRAFKRAQDRAVVMHVRAVSGAGKSAMVEHFVQTLPERGARDALVLRSRCYELEAMPFKALDGVMDALVAHLLLLDDLQVAHVLPSEVATLARVFPAFERLNAVKRLAASAKHNQDALQTRRRAEDALRKLLDNLSARAPIVLWIDDLQWGDLDSARVLRSWLLSPTASPILFVFSYRADEVATSSCLRMLLEEERAQEALPVDDVIDLLPLPSSEVRAMCEVRLRTHGPNRTQLIEQIVREAQGSPFLASQLIALADAKSARGTAAVADLSLDLMVAQTSALLPTDAKTLLAVLAVAGRPMSPKLALKAAGVKRGGRSLVHDLRGLNLVRTRDVAGVRMLEVYHDRIRERVLGGLEADETRALHESLLLTLEFSGQVDPDWLHALALGAGRAREAIQYGKAAAARASASLAFDRAASLYRACIALEPNADAASWQELSIALARSGRGVSAGEAALEAAKLLDGDEAATWTQLAAAHFMRSGHFAQGETLVRKVLDVTGFHVPESEGGVMAAIVWERTRLKLRGTRPTPRPNHDYPAELLRRVDVLMALWASTQASDPFRALLFQTRAFRAALDAGEPMRLVRALSGTSTSLTFVGTPSAIRDSDALLTRAEAINASVPSPDNAVIESTRAINAFLLGRFQDVVAHADAAERYFRADSQDDPSGNYARRWVTSSVRIGTLHAVGDYPRLFRELRVMLDEAIATDNRSVLFSMTYTRTLAEQIQGHAERARERLDAERRELPSQRISSMVVLHMVAVMSTGCWTRDYAWAHEHADPIWSRFLKSALRGGASISFMAYETHGRLLLNQYVEVGPQNDVFSRVRKDVRALEKLSLPMAVTSACRLRARLAFLQGDPGEAVAQLRASTKLLQEIGNPHEAARDRFALGFVLGGAEGEALSAAARHELAALGVVDVEGDLRAHYPEATKAGAHAG